MQAGYLDKKRPTHTNESLGRSEKKEEKQVEGMHVEHTNPRCSQGVAPKKKKKSEPNQHQKKANEEKALLLLLIASRRGGGIFKTRLNIICCMYCSQRECLCLSVWTHRRRHEKRLLVVVDVTPLGRKRSVLKPSSVVGANENCATVELSGWTDRCSGRTGPRSP